MAYIINVNRKTNSYTLRRTVRNITVNRVGKHGKAGTVQVGSTTTLPAGSDATVANSGTDTAAILDFGIPQGAKGDPGDPATNLVTSVNGRVGAVTGLAEKAELDMVEEELYQDLTQGDAATLLAANQYTDEQFNVLTYVESVQAGTNVTIDNKDPKNPVVSATGTTSISFDNVTDKPLAPAFTGLLVNNASDEEFPTDQAEYSVQPDPLTFPFRNEQGNIKAAGAVDNDDVVIKIQQDMLEEELFTDIQNGDAATLASAKSYTDEKVDYISFPVISVNDKTGIVTLYKSDIGLGNVDNTSDLNKPVSTATQTALNAKRDLSNPGLNSLYSVTAAGVQSTLRYAETIINLSIPMRDAAGRLQASAAVNPNELVPLAQLNTSLGNYVLKSGDIMTAPLTVPAINNDTVGNLASVGVNRYSWDTASFRPIGARDLGDTTNRFRRVHVSDRVDISGVWQLTGVGFPNGVVSAPVGSTYTDTAATNGAIEWKKATGTGNTGWVVSDGDTGWVNLSSIIDTTRFRTDRTIQAFIRRTASTVEIMGDVTLVNGVGSGVEAAIFTRILTGYRPNSSVWDRRPLVNTGGNALAGYTKPADGFKALFIGYDANRFRDTFLTSDPWPTSLLPPA